MEFIGPDIPWALEVYWLIECREDEDRDNSETPSKKRQAEVELISLPVLKRLRRSVTDEGLNSELQWIDEVNEYSILKCLYY